MYKKSKSVYLPGEVVGEGFSTTLNALFVDGNTSLIARVLLLDRNTEVPEIEKERPWKEYNNVKTESQKYSISL